VQLDVVKLYAATDLDKPRMRESSSRNTLRNARMKAAHAPAQVTERARELRRAEP
jgi:hypothetical protein